MCFLDFCCSIVLELVNLTVLCSQEQFGVMGDSATAMRDPIFYRWHAYVDDIFNLFKSKLPPYNNDRVSDCESIIRFIPLFCVLKKYVGT